MTHNANAIVFPTYLPATAALMLTTNTYMSQTAIANYLRNYGQSGQPFTIKSVRPGNHHYYVCPTRNGFNILETSLPTGYMK